MSTEPRHYHPNDVEENCNLQPFSLKWATSFRLPKSIIPPQQWKEQRKRDNPSYPCHSCRGRGGNYNDASARGAVGGRPGIFRRRFDRLSAIGALELYVVDRHISFPLARKGKGVQPAHPRRGLRRPLRRRARPHARLRAFRSWVLKEMS